MTKSKTPVSYRDLEAALRAALAERSRPVVKGAHKQLPAQGPRITVIVNSRPSDLVGHNVFTVVTVKTVSRFEAELEALKQARAQGLRHSVIVSIETW